MQELAALLKAERLKQGLTIAFVSEKTRISASMIEALEAGEFDRIGIPLIIRSFIRSYCEVLSIECPPLMERYGKVIGSFDRQGKGILKYREWSRSFRRKGRSRALLIILLALLAMGTLVGGAWFSIWLKRQQAQEKLGGVYPSQELPSDLISHGGALASVEGLEGAERALRHQPDIWPGGGASGSAPKSTAVDGKGPLAKPYRLSGDKPSSSEILPEDSKETMNEAERLHALELEASRITGLRLRIDNQAPITVTLKAGEKREWKVVKVADIELRDAKAVRAKWDGMPIESKKRRLRLPLEEVTKRP